MHRNMLHSATHKEWDIGRSVRGIHRTADCYLLKMAHEGDRTNLNGCGLLSHNNWLTVATPGQRDKETGNSYVNAQGIDS
jgi:hypothetical protein